MSKTKFKNAQTIVTEDFLNSIYGGLEGSSEGASLPADDPRIKGHIHDGGSGDGHASKIDLVSNVENQLTNTNLADEAVLKRNVYRSTDPLDTNLIPHYEVDSDGIKHYYLGLGSFDLQSITDNGNETTNPVIIGNNDPNNNTMYCTMFALNMPTTVTIPDNPSPGSPEGTISQKKDYALSLKLAMNEVFSWKIDGPKKVSDPSSYTDGESISGPTSNYEYNPFPYGLEQRMYHDNFGYVGFVGNKTKNFHLRVIGIGTSQSEGGYEDSMSSASMNGSTPDDSDLTSFNANQALTFWYDTDEKGSNAHPIRSGYDREVYGGVSSKVNKQPGDESGDLIFSVKPSLSARLRKDYNRIDLNNEPEIKGPVPFPDGWPLFDFAKISRYGNMELKRGNKFTTHSESMLNIKETFGIEENPGQGPGGGNSEQVPIGRLSTGSKTSSSSYAHSSKNIASIRLEPIIADDQVERETETSYREEVIKFLSLPSEIEERRQQTYEDKSEQEKKQWEPREQSGGAFINHHNYIDLSSIMFGGMTNQFRPDGRSLSAPETMVAHSNVFKFDRYFIDRGFEYRLDTHRALHNNTYSVQPISNERGSPSSPRFGTHFAKNVIPPVDPYSQSGYYAPTFMKVNIVDGDMPRDFYVPVCYPEGADNDLSALNPGGQELDFEIPEVQSFNSARRIADLGLQEGDNLVYVHGTPSGSSVKKYYYPLFRNRPTGAFNVIVFQEFPGIIFFYSGDKTQSEIEHSGIPSTSDYPGITEFTGINPSQELLQLLY